MPLMPHPMPLFPCRLAFMPPALPSSCRLAMLATFLFIIDAYDLVLRQCVCPDPAILGPDARSSAVFVLAEVFKEYREKGAGSGLGMTAEQVTYEWSGVIVQLITAACNAQSERALDQLQRVCACCMPWLATVCHAALCLRFYMCLVAHCSS